MEYVFQSPYGFQKLVQTGRNQYHLRKRFNSGVSLSQINFFIGCFVIIHCKLPINSLDAVSNFCNDTGAITY